MQDGRRRETNRRKRTGPWPPLSRRWGIAPLLLTALCVTPHAQLGAQTPDEPAAVAATPEPGQAAGAENAASADPPSRVARISVLNGDVSTEPASVPTFSPAVLNDVLTTGDRIYTDGPAEAELEAGQLAVRLGGGTDLTVTAITDALAQFGLAGGSVHLRSFAIDPGTVLELDTPEVAVTVVQPGDVRVDVDPEAHTTTVSLVSGEVQVDSPGDTQVLAAGQRLRFHAADPESGQAAYLEPLTGAEADALDGFSESRDGLYATGASADATYLNADVTGGADLAEYGAWDSSDYGPVWFPVVAGDWRPYCHGHWRWVAPWGWTWVANEPWGFAPFHYGRWAFVHSRWGWIPGPVPVRPVYAPALVVFAGGTKFSASLGYAAGGGITAWFPLGPREPYLPWYYGSTQYLNRVNASNIYNPNRAEVRAFPNQRAVNVFAGGAAQGRVYVNRERGTVAVPDASFAAGKPVAPALLHLPAETMASAPLLAHPTVVPERTMVTAGAARALPTMIGRPVLAGSVASEANGEGGAGRILFHRAEPPLPRPSFDVQRRTMQATEPGKPLSPRQMDAVRENHPAAPTPARESGSHPAAAPSHPAEAPARSDPPAAEHHH